MTDRTTKAAEGRVARAPHLMWVPIAKMKVSPHSQRDFKQHRVDQLAAEFDPEQIGYPVLNKRADDANHFWIIDGQHRVLALKAIGWGDQNVQCEVYEGLTEQQEAEVFLRRNNKLNVTAFDEFRIAVAAGREDECDINRILMAQGLRLDGSSQPGAVRAVGALRKVYAYSPATLARTLKILNESFDGMGLDGHIIHGVGMVCQRFNGEMPDTKAVERLTSLRNGADGLTQRAYQLKKQLGRPLPDCVAGAVVELVNGGKGGKKLPNWWS